MRSRLCCSIRFTIREHSRLISWGQRISLRLRCLWIWYILFLTSIHQRNLKWCSWVRTQILVCWEFWFDPPYFGIPGASHNFVWWHCSPSEYLWIPIFSRWVKPNDRWGHSRGCDRTDLLLFPELVLIPFLIENLVEFPLSDPLTFNSHSDWWPIYWNLTLLWWRSPLHANSRAWFRTIPSSSSSTVFLIVLVFIDYFFKFHYCSQ